MHAVLLPDTVFFERGKPTHYFFTKTVPGSFLSRHTSNRGGDKSTAFSPGEINDNKDIKPSTRAGMRKTMTAVSAASSSSNQSNVIFSDDSSSCGKTGDLSSSTMTPTGDRQKQKRKTALGTYAPDLPTGRGPVGGGIFQDATSGIGDASDGRMVLGNQRAMARVLNPFSGQKFKEDVNPADEVADPTVTALVKLKSSAELITIVKDFLLRSAAAKRVFRDLRDRVLEALGIDEAALDDAAALAAVVEGTGSASGNGNNGGEWKW